MYLLFHTFMKEGEKLLTFLIHQNIELVSTACMLLYFLPSNDFPNRLQK